MTEMTSAGSRLTKRSLVTAIITGATGAIAGCLGSTDGSDSSGTDDGPADEDTDSGGPTNEDTDSGGLSEADVPDFAVDDSARPTPILLAAEPVAGPVQALDDFTVELAIGNAGGDTIGDRTVEVGVQFLDDSRISVGGPDEPDPAVAELPDIDSGDWETLEVELRVTASGDWKLTTDTDVHEDVDPEIDVGPNQLTAGDTLEFEQNHFEIAALEPRFERALHYRTEEGGVGLFTGDATGLLAAADGHVLVVHRFRVENTSSDRSLGFGQVYSDDRFTSARLIGDPTDVVTGEDISDDVDTLNVGDATVFGNNDIPPGETVELVAVQEVSEADLTDATVSISLWGDAEDIRLDTVEETPALPSFDLLDASITEPTADDPIIEATVENSGTATGTFRGVAQFYHSRPTATDWVYLPAGMEATLAPGERATVSTVASRGDDRFRLLPFDEELSV